MWVIPVTGHSCQYSAANAQYIRLITWTLLDLESSIAAPNVPYLDACKDERPRDVADALVAVSRSDCHSPRQWHSSGRSECR